MARQHVESARAPAAIGPYSQGVWADDLLYLSGQTPIDPATGGLVEGGVAEQAGRVFDNLEAVLSAESLTMDDVVKCNVFLTTMDDFAAMNTVYGERFGPAFPARSTVAVAGLPLGARVEIELVARRPKSVSEADSRRIAGLLGPTIMAMVAAEFPLVQPHLYDAQIPPVVYLSGVLMFVAGLAIVRAHNIWRRDWTVLVTLSGWFFLLLGVFRMFAAGLYQRGSAGAGSTFFMILEGMLFVVGLVMTFKAYRRGAS